MPRTQIAPTLRFIGEVADKVRAHHQQHLSRGRRQYAPDHSVRRAQAGRTREGAAARGEEILDYCISVGGSITGEHGVGMEKNGADGASVFRRNARDDPAASRTLFDPQCRLNPGKVLPTGKGCLEIRQPAGMTV